MAQSQKDAPFVSFEEWKHFTTERCNLSLTADYCRKRVDALQQSSDPGTRAFVGHYGSAYRDRVVTWFQRAGEEAVS